MTRKGMEGSVRRSLLGSAVAPTIAVLDTLSKRLPNPCCEAGLESCACEPVRPEPILQRPQFCSWLFSAPESSHSGEFGRETSGRLWGPRMSNSNNHCQDQLHHHHPTPQSPEALALKPWPQSAPSSHVPALPEQSMDHPSG